MSDDPDLCNLNIQIDLPSSNICELVKKVIRVDKQPKRSRVQIRKIDCANKSLEIQLVGDSTKQLRTAADGLLDKISLVLETLSAFN